MVAMLLSGIVKIHPKGPATNYLDSEEMLNQRPPKVRLLLAGQGGADKDRFHKEMDKEEILDQLLRVTYATEGCLVGTIHTPADGPT